MPEFTVNTHRFDPYKNFKFKVKWDDKYVAGLQKCAGLKRTTEVTEWKSAGNNGIVTRLPGRTTWGAITLEQGLTHDRVFQVWANQVNDGNNEASGTIVNYRKEVIIELMNEAGQTVISYLVHRCWVSEYQALPDLDSNGKAVAITMIKLENEGWAEELVPEPTEP